MYKVLKSVPENEAISIPNQRNRIDNHFQTNGTIYHTGKTKHREVPYNPAPGIGTGQTMADGMITPEVCQYVGAGSQASVNIVDEEICGIVKSNRLPYSISSSKE